MKILLITYVVTLLSASMFLLQDDELSESMERGKDIYSDFCVTCHLVQGEGVEGVFPPLAKSDYLMEQRMESIRGVKFGQSGKIIVNGVTYDNVMMPMGLDDAEVADVMNYIMNSWGNQSDDMVTESEVNAIPAE